MMSLAHIRLPDFYVRCGVPDTFEGRFDLLLVHLFLLMNRILPEQGGDVLSQALFDAAFQNMYQTLREMGVGDVGVPKRMKKMMLAFNGRMNAYKNALESENPDMALKEALHRNLYSGVVQLDDPAIHAMAEYMRAQIKNLSSIQTEDLMMGVFSFSKSI